MPCGDEPASAEPLGSMSLQAVELGYRDNPYHNAAHAADVVQTLGCMLLTEEFRASLTAMELLAMLIGACCHDVGHPGSHWVPDARVTPPLAPPVCTFLGSPNVAMCPTYAEKFGA